MVKKYIEYNFYFQFSIGATSSEVDKQYFIFC